MIVINKIKNDISLFDEEAAHLITKEHQDKALLAIEARKELEVQHNLSLALDKERKFKIKQDINNAVFNSDTVELKYDKKHQIEVLDELSRQGYSKVIVLEGADGELKTYRVSQANKSVIKDFDNKIINVLNRLAPLASCLVSSELGDDVEFRDSYIGTVVSIDYVKKSQNRPDDFDAFELLSSDFFGDKKSQKLFNARNSINEWFESLKYSCEQAITGNISDRSIGLEDSSSLSSEFYTRTTKEQEELIQYPNSGVMLIEGIAGSGKTSVALGRVKKLRDSSYSDPDDESYDDFFKDSHRMVGFVLHKQLVPYLKDTCSSAGLNLPGMPIKEYMELRQNLIIRYQDLLQLKMPGNTLGKYQRVNQHYHFVEQTQEIWLQDIQSEILKLIIDEIIASLDNNSSRFDDFPLPEKLKYGKDVYFKHIVRIAWKEFLNEAKKELNTRLNHYDKWRYPLKGIIRDLVKIYQKWHAFFDNERAWYISGNSISRKRITEDDKLFYPFDVKGFDSQTGNAVLQLRRRLRDSVRGYFRLDPNGVKFKLTDLYVRVINSNEKLNAKYGDSKVGLAKVSLGKQKLTESDLDLLTILSSLIVSGNRDKEVAYHLLEPSFYTSVFIDEVQDFSELQVLNMVLEADPKRFAITAVGDFKQQLYSNTVNNLQSCFPMASPAQHEVHKLTNNKRQNAVLANYSQYVREFLGGDIITVPEPNFTSTELKRINVDSEHVHEAIQSFLSEIGPDKSIAVICPTKDIAKKLDEELSNDITALFRESHYAANSNELNKPYYVHFTTPKPTKGLEFDVVIIPFFNKMVWDDSVEGNHLYVAVSRAREKLLLIDCK